MAEGPEAPPHALLVELGRGGMGIVHLARRGDGRLVVVKRLRPELARNVAVRRSFVEEARIAARIEHPNVAQVLSSGFDAKGVPWLEMEWAPGVSLQALDDAAPLPWDLYVSVIADLLAGLGAAHISKGEDGRALDLVHRDVSPHNVLVTYEGRAKVIDFGIAKARDSTLETTTGVVKGKATYLAPEQAGRRNVDARTDLFAVGVMLWQRLAGQRLWEGVSEPEIFHRLTTGQIPDLAAVAPDAPDAVVAVVRRALAPDPADRFASAGAMREALLEASPARADAAAEIARHVKAAFADELREKEQLEAVGNGAADVAATTSTFLPSGVTRSPTPRRSLTIAGVLGLAVVAIGVAFWRPASVVPASVAVPACTADDACGAGAHCGDDGACASLTYDGCTTILPDAPAGARALYFGAMFPLSGPDADAFGRSNARAAELAVREVNHLAGGVPSGGKRRPLGLVLCDDAAFAEPRAKHLAASVPAVIGFRASDEVLTLSRNTFFPRGVLVLSALNSSPLLAQMPAGDPRLFYRTTASATAFASQMARATASMLGPELRRRAHLAPSEKLRVAVVRSGNATGVAYAEKVLRELAGAPDVEAREVAVGDPGAADNATLRAAIDALAAAPPHLVLALSDGLFPSVIAPLEARLHGTESAHPWYLGATPWEDDAFRAFIAARPERRGRFFAVSWPTSHAALVGFVERYKETFGETITPATASPAPYDSLYLLAYAAAAAQETKGITGAGLARALAKLEAHAPAAPTVEVGPSAVVEGLANVARGEEIDLQGVLSRFDFDPATGDSPVDAVVLCTTFDAKKKLVDAADLPITSGPFTCPGADVDTTTGVRR